MDDELRKAVKQFLLAHDAYGANNAIKNLRIEDLRAALANNANAAPQDQANPVECERCGLAPDLHTPTHWCDNQSFQVAAPQQPVTADELSLAWGYLRSWFGIADWTVTDAANFRIMFEQGYRAGAARSTAPASREWQSLTEEMKTTIKERLKGWGDTRLIAEVFTAIEAAIDAAMQQEQKP